MSKKNWIVGGLFLASSLALNAQTQKTTQQNNAAAGQEATAAQQIGSNDKTGVSADTVATANGSQGSNAENLNDQETDARASNTPAVPQTTTSQSGSPAILAGDKGSDRDGTNNVQRASMNMAGSPAAGLKVDDGKSDKVDGEAEDRQQYSQDKERSAENQDRADGSAVPGSSGSAGESDQIDNKSRRENNAISDQNLSAKEKNSNQKDKRKKADDKKAKKKG